MKASGATAPASPASTSAEAALEALDARARAVYETVRDAVTAHGYPPSMREIGAAVGLTSPSSVKHQLDKLERLGLVRRDPNRPRALEVILPAQSASTPAIEPKAPESPASPEASEDTAGAERPASPDRRHSADPGELPSLPVLPGVALSLIHI